MSLYKGLLIDIIYYLRQANSNQKQCESEIESRDRENLAQNYRITASLIDIVFEILKGDVIEFDPYLRSSQDFLKAKEQISSLETVDSVYFNTMITTEECSTIENPIIRGIILDQELLSEEHQLKSYNSKQIFLFMHLIFLSFTEIRQNNSILAKRKYVLSSLFTQSTYSYQLPQSDYQFIGQDIDKNQVTQEKQHQDLNLTEHSRDNQQGLQNLKQTQTDCNSQSQQIDHIKMRQITEEKFYFRINYPIEIESLSPHKIKMTFLKNHQYVYSWSQLDRSSYFHLESVHPKAFCCWTSMLKLLNQQMFQQFIDDQIQHQQTSDLEVPLDIDQKDNQKIDNDLKINNIVRIDKRQSVVKFSNKIRIIEQDKIQAILKQVEEQIKIVDDLSSRRNQIESFIEYMQIKEQQLMTRIIQKDDAPGNSQQPIKEQESRVDEQYIHNNKKILYREIQNSDNQFNDEKKLQQIDKDIAVDQQDRQKKEYNIHFDFQNLKSMHRHSSLYHQGQWKFGKQYPIQIDKLTNSRLLMKMKGNKLILIEWWQFDYDSLNNLFLANVNLQAAQVWSILLLLIDEDQFFKLWKGEVIEQMQGQEQDEEEKEKEQFEHIAQNQDINQLPEKIIKNDYYRYIMKFQNCVQILTTKQKKIELQQYKKLDQILQEYEEKNEKIQFRPAFYNSKIKVFEERVLEQTGVQTINRLPLQYLNTQKVQNSHLQNNNVSENQNQHAGLWIFDEDYPIKINIMRSNLNLLFKNTIKNTLVKWEQLNYQSLIKLIDEKINIRAGQAWSVMLTLLDHEQFYKLWKNYHQSNSNDLISQSVHRQVKGSQQSVTSKRDMLDYIPQKIIRLSRLKVIVKFEHYVQVFTNTEFLQYKADSEIPETEFSKIKIKLLQCQYNQNIKSFQERYKVEQNYQLPQSGYQFIVQDIDQNQFTQEKQHQDLNITEHSRNNQQGFYNFKQTQTDCNSQSQQIDHIKMRQITEEKFYFRSNYPIEIESLSPHKIKMTFLKNQQYVYSWSQLDRSSYFHLMTTNSEVFHYWKTMLKLLNQQMFLKFINGQLENNLSDHEVAPYVNKQSSNKLDDLELDDIFEIDNIQLIVKFDNKVIIIQLDRLYQNYQSFQQDQEICNKLIIKRNQIDCQIEQIKKQFHLNYSLDEWQEQQKQLETRTIWNYSNIRRLNDNVKQATTHQEQLTNLVDQISFNDDKIMKTNTTQIQLSKQINHESRQQISEGPAIQVQDFHQNKQIDAYQSVPAQVPFSYVECQHKEQWVFDKQYPLKIVKLSNERLSLIMKSNRMFIIEWWQFNYETLRNLLIQEGSMQSAYIWSIMLILIDEEQFFKLWKGEFLQYVSNMKPQVEDYSVVQAFQEQQYIQQCLNNSLIDLPEIIIQNDHYRFIIKFRNNVQILTSTELEQLKANKYSKEFKYDNWQIQKRQIFYNRKLKLFKKRVLQQSRVKCQFKTLDTSAQLKNNEFVQSKCPLNQSNLSKGLRHVYEDYPIRVDLIGKNSLKLQFKNKIKNAIIKWEQFEYKQVMELIEGKINIRAGEAWCNMLILLDHDQFYTLWKAYHYGRQSSESKYLQVDRKLNELSQESIKLKKLEQLQLDKRDPLDYIAQSIVKLDNSRLIVKFQNYVQILTKEEIANYRDVLEIPESQFSKLKIKFSKAFYNQNMKTFQQRLQYEEKLINKYEQL